MGPRRLPIFWRVFALNAGLLTGIAVLLIVTPVTVSAPIALAEAAIVLAGLAVTLLVNAVLLRHAFRPLERLSQRMEMVDLLRPGQRLDVSRDDDIGRVLAAFNRMLDRLERERDVDPFEEGERRVEAIARHREQHGCDDEQGRVDREDPPEQR